jgi:hypothetical protein
MKIKYVRGMLTGRVGEEHDQTIDTKTPSSRRRQTVFQPAMSEPSVSAFLTS